MLDRSHERLRVLLDPVAEQLQAFEAKVEKVYGDDRSDRAALREQLRLLQETQARLHEDAGNLARALTGDSKAQGDWGELILERVLETAGLTEGREYDLQLSRTDEDGGRKRPDAVVYLPANRAVIVDAKCSLTAFVEAMRAPEGDEREAALDRHLGSVRRHVKELAAKDYQDLLRAADARHRPALRAERGRLPRGHRAGGGALRGGLPAGGRPLQPDHAARRAPAHRPRLAVREAERQRAADRRGGRQAPGEAGRLRRRPRRRSAPGSIRRRGPSRTRRGKLATGRGNVMKRAADIQRLGARVKPDRVESLTSEGCEGGDEEVDRPVA